MYEPEENPINELLAQTPPKIPVSQDEPTTYTDLVLGMVASANKNVTSARYVTPDSALDVAERSLTRTLLNPDLEARAFAMVREVSDFLNTAITGKEPTIAREHTDLLRVGHPLSTAFTNLTAVEIAKEKSEWIAGDSRISEELRPVVASAFLTVPETAERQFSVARLEAADAQDVPRDVVLSLIAFGNPFAGGNSFLARSARAKLQRRDRKGRFAFMGGGARTFIRLASNFIKSVTGRFVGGDPSTDTFDIEINDPELGSGIITVPTKSAEGVKALISGKLGELLAQRAKPKSATFASKYAVDAASLKLKPAPFGWKQDEEVSNLFVSADGYSAQKFDKFGNIPNVDKNAEVIGFNSDKTIDDTKPVYELKNSNGDVMGYYQSWGDIQASAGRADVKGKNEAKRSAKKSEELWGDQIAGDHPESFVEETPADPNKKFSFSFYRSKKNKEGRGGYTVRRWKPDNYQPVIEFINDPKRKPKDVEVRGLRDGSTRIEPDEELFELTSHPVPQDAEDNPPRIVGYAQDWDDVVAMSEDIEMSKPPVPVGTIQVDAQGRQFTWVYRPAQIIPQVGYIDEGWEKAYIVPKSHIPAVPEGDQAYDGSPIPGTPDKRPNKRPYPGFEWTYVPPVEGQEQGSWIQIPKYEQRPDTGIDNVKEIDEDGNETDKGPAFPRQPRPQGQGQGRAPRPQRRPEPVIPSIPLPQAGGNPFVKPRPIPKKPTTPPSVGNEWVYIPSFGGAGQWIERKIGDNKKPYTVQDVFDAPLRMGNPVAFKSNPQTGVIEGIYETQNFTPDVDARRPKGLAADLYDAAPSIITNASLDQLTSPEYLDANFDSVVDAKSKIKHYVATPEQIRERDRLADATSPYLSEINNNVIKRIKDKFGEDAFEVDFEYGANYSQFGRAYRELHTSLTDKYRSLGLNPKRAQESATSLIQKIRDARGNYEQVLAEADVPNIANDKNIKSLTKQMLEGQSKARSLQERARPIHAAIGQYKREEYKAAMERAGVKMYDGDGTEIFDFPPDPKGEVANAVKKALSYYPQSVIEGLRDRLMMNPKGQKIKLKTDPNRGEFRRNSAEPWSMVIAPSTNKSTDKYESITFHEVGHSLEEAFPELRTLAFLNSSDRMFVRDENGNIKFDTESGDTLDVIYHGTDENNPDEKGVNDRYMDKYNGRVYNDTPLSPVSGGETVTMALEQLVGHSEYFVTNDRVMEAIRSGAVKAEDALLGNDKDNAAMLGLMVMLGNRDQLSLPTSEQAVNTNRIYVLGPTRRVPTGQRSPIKTENLSLDRSPFFSATKQTDGFASEAPLKPRSPKYIDGMDVRNQILAEASRVAYFEGRFPIPRTADQNGDIRKAVKAQYSDVFEYLKQENPEFAGKFKDFNDFWSEIEKNKTTLTSYFGNEEQGEFRRTVNNAYAKKILGLDEDGFIEVYRNSYQGRSSEGASQADAAAGYVSLDRNMAWDYQSQRKGENEFAGRYSIKVTPAEYGGIIGYSEGLDEFAAVLGKNVTSMEDRVVRHGDLEVLPNPRDYGNRDTGNSPYRFFLNGFRFIQAAGEFNYTDFGDLIDRAGGRDAVRAKIVELFPGTTFDRESDESFSLGTNLFQQHIKRTSEGKAVLDPQFLSLAGRDAQSIGGRRGDDLDNFLKGTLAIQELTGEPIMEWKLDQKPEVDDIKFSAYTTPNLDFNPPPVTPDSDLFGAMLVDVAPAASEPIDLANTAIEPSKIFGNFTRGRSKQAKNTPVTPSKYNSASEKARDILSRITDSKVLDLKKTKFYNEQIKGPFGGWSDGAWDAKAGKIVEVRTEAASASYTSPRGEKFTLELLSSVLDDRPIPIAGEVRVYNEEGTEVGLLMYMEGEQSGETNPDAPNDIAPIHYGSWQPGQNYSYITLAHVYDDFYQRNGLATAMLEFARSRSNSPIYHSSSLTDNGRDFSGSVKSALPTPDIIDEINDYMEDGSSNLRNVSLPAPKFVENPRTIYRGMILSGGYQGSGDQNMDQLIDKIKFDHDSKGYGTWWSSSPIVAEENSTGDESHNVTWVYGATHDEPVYGVMLQMNLNQDALPVTPENEPFTYAGEKVVRAPYPQRFDTEVDSVVAHFFRRDTDGSRTYVGSREIDKKPKKDFSGKSEKAKEIASRTAITSSVESELENAKDADPRTKSYRVTRMGTFKVGDKEYLLSDVRWKNNFGDLENNPYVRSGSVEVYDPESGDPEYPIAYMNYSTPRRVGIWFDDKDLSEVHEGDSRVDLTEPFSIIEMIETNEDYRRIGLATAMLEFARKDSEVPICHSSVVTPWGEQFAESVQSPLPTPAMDYLDASNTFAGLTDKSVEVRARITPVGEPEKFNNMTFYTKTERQATYVTPDGEQFVLWDLFFEHKDYGSEMNKRSVEAVDSEGKSAGTLNISSLRPDENGNYDLAAIDPNYQGVIDTSKGLYVISMAEVNLEHRRKGIATAMLEFARMNADKPIYHSSILSPNGRRFADAARSPIATPEIDPEYSMKQAISEKDGNGLPGSSEKAREVSKNMFGFKSKVTGTGKTADDDEYTSHVAVMRYRDPKTGTLYNMRYRGMEIYNEKLKGKTVEASIEVDSIDENGNVIDNGIAESSYAPPYIYSDSGKLWDADDLYAPGVKFDEYSMPPSTIEMTWVYEPHQRRGLATAMLEFARRMNGDGTIPIFHSWNRSEEGVGFADAVQSPIQTPDLDSKDFVAYGGQYKDFYTDNPVDWLTDEQQRRAVNNYRGTVATIVNQRLRDDMPLTSQNSPSGTPGSGILFDTVNGLDDAMELSPGISRDTKVYRTIQADIDGKILESIEEGSIIVDKAYMSTTANKTFAQMLTMDYRGEFDERSIFFEIEIPKGTKGIPVSRVGLPVAPENDEQRGIEQQILAGYEKEAEFLLPRNSRLEIIFVDKKFKKVIARYVPSEPLQSSQQTPDLNAEGGSWPAPGTQPLSQLKYVKDPNRLPQYSKQAHRDALKQYQNKENYGMMNRYYRSLPTDNVIGMFKGYAEALREYIYEQPVTKKDMTLFRGLKSYPNNPYENLKVGDVIREDGFLSASDDPSGARWFGKDGFTISLDVPAGEPALDTNARGRESKFMLENEWILPPYRQLRYKGKDDNGVLMFDVLPEESSVPTTALQSPMQTPDLFDSTPTKDVESEEVDENGFTEAEADAIYWYSDMGFDSASRYLRKGDNISESEKKKLDTLLGLFKKNKTEGPITLYRGRPIVNEERANEINNLKVGQVLEDAGIMSTSFDKDKAEFFAGMDIGKVKARAVFEISVPEGSNVFEMPDDYTVYGESEVLLPPKTKFKVTDIEKRGDQYYISVDLITEESSQSAAPLQSPQQTPDLEAEQPAVDRNQRPYELEGNPPRPGTERKTKFQMYNQYGQLEGFDMYGPHSQVLATADLDSYVAVDAKTNTMINLAAISYEGKSGEFNLALKQVLNDPDYPRISDEELWETAKELIWVQRRGYKSISEIPEQDMRDVVTRTLTRWRREGNDDKLKNFVDQENAFVQQKLGQMTMKDGSKVGEIADEIAEDSLDELGLIAQNEDVSLAMPLGNLKKFIEEGRYKTVYETKRRNKGGTREYYLGARESIEYQMGVPEGTPPEKRPVYGVIGETLEDIGHYGNTRVVFKDEVKNRTSVTLGDSIDGGSKPYWVSDLAEGKYSPDDFWKKSGGNVVFHTENTSSPFFEYERTSSGSVLTNYPKKSVLNLTWGGSGYIESQIHGGVTMQDVAKIVVPSRNSLPAATRTMLANMGIEIEVDDSLKNVSNN